MAKLIAEYPEAQFVGANKVWLVGDRFELTIFYGKKYVTFFMEDKYLVFNSLTLVPKAVEGLRLVDEIDVGIVPSIDTCGLYVPKDRCDEIFKRLDVYLCSLK